MDLGGEEWVVTTHCRGEIRCSYAFRACPYRRIANVARAGAFALPKDGARTISTCPSSNAPIPGKMHYPRVVSSGRVPEPPECCVNCGDALPWTGKIARPQISRISVEEVLTRRFERFSLVVGQLRQRHAGRETIDVGDEYDVQDLTHALLRLYWDDVREEKWTPSYARKSARVGFSLLTERAVVEIKMSRKGLTQKELGDQLLVDIARYAEMRDGTRLYCFVFDPGAWIKNPRGVETDLAKQSEKFGRPMLHSRMM